MVIVQGSPELILKEELDRAKEAQRVEISEEAEAYLVMRLAVIHQWRTFGGRETLSELFLKVPSMGWRSARSALRSIGDASLLVSAGSNWQRYFGWRKAARGLPVEYFLRMGRGAYDRLAPESPFEEVAEMFPQVTSVMSQALGALSLRDDRDFLATYDTWTATGNPFLAGLLVRQGVSLSVPEGLPPS